MVHLPREQEACPGKARQSAPDNVVEERLALLGQRRELSFDFGAQWAIQHFCDDPEGQHLQIQRRVEEALLA